MGKSELQISVAKNATQKGSHSNLVNQTGFFAANIKEIPIKTYHCLIIRAATVRCQLLFFNSDLPDFI